MNTLIAGSLRLEPQCQAHAEEMFAVLRDPAIYEFENEAPLSVDVLRDRYARMELRLSPDGTEHWLNWVIRLPGGELAGFLQATVLARGRAYVAYELASRFWRQGLASTSLQAVLRELATHYSVREAFAVLKSANYRSRGLLDKLGFTPLADTEPAPWAQEPDEFTLHKALFAGESAAESAA